MSHLLHTIQCFTHYSPLNFLIKFSMGLSFLLQNPIVLQYFFLPYAFIMHVKQQRKTVVYFLKKNLMHREIVVNKSLGRDVQTFRACVLNNLQHTKCPEHSVFHLWHQQLVSAANQTSKCPTAEMRNPILVKNTKERFHFSDPCQPKKQQLSRMLFNCSDQRC